VKGRGNKDKPKQNLLTIVYLQQFLTLENVHNLALSCEAKETLPPSPPMNRIRSIRVGTLRYACIVSI
jgi:hypothetical protein